MTILECRELTKTYDKGETPAVKNLTLSIDEGTIFGFLGPNGAGKTTTIKMMTGLIQASEGEVFVGGSPVTLNRLESKRDLGYLSQEPRYYPWMTGRELLTFVAGLYGMDRTAAAARAVELLRLSGLVEAADKKIGAYSGGMVQRIGIAQALVNNPKILFLDEPVSDLDPIGRKEVLDFIAALRGKTTVFMSTHILADVERVCDRVGIINRGEMIVIEDTNTLKNRYAPPHVELRFDTQEDGRRFQELLKKENRFEHVVEDNGKFLIRPENFTQSRNELLRLMADHSLSLNGLEVKSASLEEVFVKLIGESNTGGNDGWKSDNDTA